MPTQFDPKNIQWIDADTFEYEGDRFRVRGYDAPEKSGIFVDQEGTVRSKAGQVGGAESATAIQKLFQSGGYDRFEETGDVSEGRKVVDLYNSQGDTLTGAAYRSGIIDPNLFTNAEGIKESQAGGLRQELRGKREYEDAFAAVRDVKSRPQQIKTTAANEKEYRDGLVQVVALEQGLDLSNPEDYTRALQSVQDGDFDRDFNPFSGVDFRSYDRTITNVAENQIAESWRTGWRGMLAGIAGFGEAAGVLSDSEATKQWGELKSKQWQDAFQEAPDLKNVDWKDIDGVWSGLQWFTNNTALSAPYLAILAGGALASPLTGGASAAIAFGSLAASYGGQVWNDMEGDKGKVQAGAAISAGLAMAVVDKLGFKNIIKPSQILTKEGREQAAQQIAARRGISVEKAKELLTDATRKETKSFLRGIGDFASANIARNSIQDIGKRIGIGGAAEGITEAIQEGVGYSTAVGFSDKDWNQKEFNDTLISSFITGGALGTGFAGAGQLQDVGAQHALRRDLDRGDSKLLNDFAQIAIDYGAEGNVNDIIKTNKGLTATVTPHRDKAYTAELARQGKIDRSILNASSISEGLGKLLKRLPETFRASATTAFRPEVLRKSATARKLYGLIGQPLGKIISGLDVEGFRDNIRAQGLTILNPQGIAQDFGFKRGTPKELKQVSNWIREYVALGGTTVRKQDLPEHLQTRKAALDSTIERLQEFSNWDYDVKNKTNKDEGYYRDDINKLPDWWLKHQGWDWKKVRQNRDAWFKFMRKHTDYDNDQLLELFNKIANAENRTDFSLVEGIAWKPFKGRKDAISDYPEYQQFASDNIIENLASAVEQTSSYAAYTRYFGEGGKDLDRMFRDMKEEGLTQEELTHMAAHVKAIIDAGTGNYQAIKNPTLAKASRLAASFTTTVGLPLAALSSSPEFAMTIYGSRDGGDLKNAWDASKEVAKEYIKIWKGVLEGKDPFKDGVPSANRGEPPSQKLLNEAGIYNDDASVAVRYGLAETDVALAWWMQQFFKWYGITGITQMQRRQNAAAATGFISDRLAILAARPEGAELNQEQLEISVQLRDLGMDVDGMVELYQKYNDPSMFDRLKLENRDPTDQEAINDLDFIDDQMNTAIYYFVNERIQNPKAFNRPLFFQDPHFQLLTQFNGFNSTFTATKVPKIWRDYLTKGSPAVKYNTFALMIMMIGLAGASQWLRDYIKFGGSTPYLSETQLIQRAFQASGLLGTGERLVQTVLPLYEERGQGISGKIFGESIGAAPAWRTFENLGSAVGQFREGETERALGNALKSVPGIGAFNPVRNVINQFVHGNPLDPYPNK